MASLILSEEEYTFITGLEKDLLERAKSASPRAATHFRIAAKIHSDFIALEEGKRAASAKKEAAKQERDALKLQRQQERLAAIQQQISKSGEKAQSGQGQTQRSKATA